MFHPHDQRDRQAAPVEIQNDSVSVHVFGAVLSERGSDHRLGRRDADGVLDFLLHCLALGILQPELNRDLQVKARDAGRLGHLVARQLETGLPRRVGDDDRGGCR